MSPSVTRSYTATRRVSPYLLGNRARRGAVSCLPDPEPDQFEQNEKAKVIVQRGRRNKRALFFVGSLEPLELARRQQRRRRRRSASLDANVDNHPGKDGEEDEDADADGDTDDGEGEGVWPRVFVVPTIVVTELDAEPKMEMVGTRITPEEVERAIGAAFAIGTAI